MCYLPLGIYKWNGIVTLQRIPGHVLMTLSSLWPFLSVATDKDLMKITPKGLYTPGLSWPSYAIIMIKITAANIFWVLL